jgi:hypothetical protein
MYKKIVVIAHTKGFISRDNLIEPSEDYFPLWLFEVQKWLRDKKEIEIVIEVYTNEDETGIEYEYVNYSDRIEDEIDHGDGPFDTYEDALEAACTNALMLLENYKLNT